MHIDKSKLEKLKDGEYFVDASDLGLEVGKFPAWLEVIEGGYVVNRFENPRRHSSGYPDYELLSVHYFSANGDTLRVLND